MIRQVTMGTTQLQFLYEKLGTLASQLQPVINPKKLQLEFNL